MSKNTQRKRNLKPRQCKKPTKSKITEENSLTVRRSDIWSSIRIKSAEYQIDGITHQNPPQSTAGTADQYYIIKKQPSSNMEGYGGIYRDR